MTPVRIRRPERAGPKILLTPLVDVLLILLVFFMVTSTYLDLDMIPMAEPAETPVATVAPPADARGEGSVEGSAEGSADGSAASGTILIRLNAAGRAFLGGAELAGAALSDAVARRLARTGPAPVLILPSVRASTQALVDVLGAVSAAGAEQVQVVRFGPAREAQQ